VSSAPLPFCAGGVLGCPSPEEPGGGGGQKPRLASQQSLGGPQGSDGGSELALMSSSAGSWPFTALRYPGMPFWAGRSAAPAPRCRCRLCSDRTQEKGLPVWEPAGRPSGCQDLAVEEKVGGEAGVKCSVCDMDQRHKQWSQPADGMMAPNRCARCQRMHA